MCSHHLKRVFSLLVLLQPERRSGLQRTTFSTLADNIGLHLTPSFPRKIWKPFINKVLCNLRPSGVLKRLPHTSVCLCFYSHGLYRCGSVSARRNYFFFYPSCELANLTCHIFITIILSHRLSARNIIKTKWLIINSFHTFSLMESISVSLPGQNQF